MRVIPGMTVIVPADDVEARAVTRAAYECDGPVYMRFARLASPVINDPRPTSLNWARASSCARAPTLPSLPAV